MGRSVGLPCAHSHVSAPGSPDLSWRYLDMENFSTGSALGAVAQDQPINIFLVVIVNYYPSS